MEPKDRTVRVRLQEDIGPLVSRLHWLQNDRGIDPVHLAMRLLEKNDEVVTLMPNVPEDANSFLENIENPLHLAYLVAANSRIKTATCQKILEIDNLNDKLRALISLLSREKEVLSMDHKIQAETHEEMGKDQRDQGLGKNVLS